MVRALRPLGRTVESLTPARTRECGHLAHSLVDTPRGECQDPFVVVRPLTIRVCVPVAKPAVGRLAQSPTTALTSSKCNPANTKASSVRLLA